MKTITTTLGLFLLAVASTHLAADDRESDPTFYSESIYGDFQEDEYTPWMPKDDLQMMVDNLDTSHKWIYRVEGRDFRGLSQYRYALRKRPDGVTHYHVRSGRTDAEYYRLGVSYQRDGYKRVSLQLFKDSSGIMRYNSVWFKYDEKMQNKPDMATPRKN